MIIVIDALNRTRFAPLLDAVHKLRARVFDGRLGWDVHIRDGREVDRFDALDPVHEPAPVDRCARRHAGGDAHAT